MTAFVDVMFLSSGMLMGNCIVLLLLVHFYCMVTTDKASVSDE